MVHAVNKEKESLKDEIKSLQKTVQKQDDVLERQKKTIKVQSSNTQTFTQRGTRNLRVNIMRVQFSNSPAYTRAASYTHA